MERCFVVTCASGGWDNVRGVYIANSEKEVAKRFLEDRDIDDVGTSDPQEWMEEHDYIIHDKQIINLK